MIVTIGDFITADEPGFACSKGKLVKTGVKHLRPFNISSDGYLDMTEVFELPPTEVPRGKSSLAKGDILFNNTNSVEWVGKAALITSDMSVGWSNHITRIKLDRSKVLPEWFTYWLRQKQSAGYFAANATQWVSQAAYRVAELKLITIDLPPLGEQQRIVDILDRAASIQRLRKAADDKLKEIIPALFVDMFGDPTTNPKAWPMTDIGSLILSAEYGSSSKASDIQIGLPMLRMGNVTMQGDLQLDDLKYVELEQDEEDKFRLAAGDILFNRTNSKELVGKTGIWWGDTEAVYASYFIRLRTDQTLMLPEVLWAFMNSAAIKRLLFGMARGAIGQSNINSKELKAISIYRPPMELQRRFQNAVAEIMRKRKLGSSATDASAVMRVALTSQLLN